MENERKGVSPDRQHGARCLKRCLEWARLEALLELNDPAAAKLLEAAIAALEKTYKLNDKP